MKFLAPLLLLLHTANAQASWDAQDESFAYKSEASIALAKDRALQEVGTPPFTPLEIRRIFYTFVLTTLRGNLSETLNKANTNSDGKLDGSEINALLSKAVCFVAGGSVHNSDGCPLWSFVPTETELYFWRPSYNAPSFSAPTVLPPTIGEPSPVMEPTFVQPSPVLEPTFVQPSPVMEPTFVQPSPVVAPTFVQPPPVVAPTIVQPTIVQPTIIVQPPVKQPVTTPTITKPSNAKPFNAAPSVITPTILNPSNPKPSVVQPSVFQPFLTNPKPSGMRHLKQNETFYAGHMLPLGGEASRDPHIMTFGGHHLGYSGVCDLVLFSNGNFTDQAGLVIYGRTEFRGRGSGENGSVLTGVAIRLGNDVLEVFKDGTHYLNGVEGALLPVPLSGGYTLQREEAEVCYGPSLGERCAPSVNLDITSGVTTYLDVIIEQRISIKAHRGFVDLNVALAPENLAGTVGLMGTFPSASRLDKLARNGAVITDDKLFGEEWQVKPEEGDAFLFLEARAPQYPDQCMYPSDIRY